MALFDFFKKKNSEKDIIPFDRITHFEYKGHKYIMDYLINNCSIGYFI